MSVKCFEKDDSMSAELIMEAKGMADVILTRVHRGPGDTVDAAMHRAERQYGVPAKWLHRLRYRELNDMPMTVFASLAKAYLAVNAAADRAYEAERHLGNERHSKVLWLADLVAGKKD